MTVIINGQPRDVSEPLTVAELLQRLEIPPRGTAVELNLEIIPRIRQNEQLLADGDRLEIVSLVGGG